MIGTDETIDDLTGKTRLGGGSGVATSDELLEFGRGGLRFFERFLPRYEAWTGRTLGGGISGIKATYDEVSGIRFDRLRADVERLTGVHSDLTDHNDRLSGSVCSLRDLWEGDAADEADGYSSQFMRDASGVLDGIDVARTLISSSADRAETAVMTRAKLVAGLDSHHVGGLTPRQVDQVIAAAQGNAGPVQLFEMVVLTAFAPLDSAPAFAEEKTFNGMMDQASAWMSQRGQQWLDGVFVPSVEASYQAFDQYTKITTQDVGDSWTGMNDGVGSLDPTGSDQTAPSDAGAPAPGASTPPPITTSPTDGAYPGTTTPGAATPTPVTEQDTPTQVTTPSSTLPPVPQTSDSPIGSSLQNSPKGPGDAQLAQAPNVTGTGETGKVGDGLTLTKPDDSGHAQLTVRHPDGTTGSYNVDLNAMGNGTQGGSNVSGAGNTVIHDGAMTITLHRPTPDGPVTVTVDDGSGAPQSYQVDFDGDGPAGAGDPTLATSQPADLLGPGGSPGVSTALGSGTPSLGTTADGSAGAAGSGVGGVGGGQAGGGADPKPQPGSYRGVGELPAAAAAGAVGGIAGRAAAGGPGGGMGMMPMMGGMGAGAGKDHERKGGRWNSTEDFFGEDTSSYAKIADMLEPELPRE